MASANSSFDDRGAVVMKKAKKLLVVGGLIPGCSSIPEAMQTSGFSLQARALSLHIRDLEESLAIVATDADKLSPETLQILKERWANFPERIFDSLHDILHRNRLLKRGHSNTINRFTNAVRIITKPTQYHQKEIL